MNPPHRLSPAFRALDLLLVPAMYVLGGFRLSCIQRTHFWHCMEVSVLEIDPTIGQVIIGTDPSRHANRVLPFPFFHAPLFGGWRRYVVLEAATSTDAWHVGWIHRRWPTGARPRNHLQRLRICTARVRVLEHPVGYETLFFGIDGAGQQIPIRTVGRGVLGDGQYADAPLF